MYGTLAVSHRALADLGSFAAEAELEALRSLARPIEGLRVLNLSVTGFGTGTAELLSSSVPLLSDLGLDCHWQVVRSSEADSTVTRAMYRALGGVHVPWTQEMSDAWVRYASMNASLLSEPFDVVVVHDPQPAGIRSFVRDGDEKWLVHSHMDLSSAQDDVWMLLRPHVQGFDGAIFESSTFQPAGLSMRTWIVPPAIDPNSARNMPLPDDLVRTVLQRYGIDPEKPMAVQVSPCDAASDLVGAVNAAAKVRERVPDLQIVMVLITEAQDGEARSCYDELARRCADDPLTFVVSGREVGNVEINVFQRAAGVVMQKGLRKGFGLWVADALWKERAAVVSPRAGLLEQVIDGETGLVAHGDEKFSSAITQLLEDPELAARYGERGRRHVAERFLITRYLRDYLTILNELHRSA
jgi:trehalose synthase